MAQRSTGLRRVLSAASVYAGFQALLGAGAVRRRIVEVHLRADTGMVVLDIGCGTGDVLDALPDVHYHGFDLSPSYIERARRKYGARGQFWVERVSAASLSRLPPCDRVLACAVLHHLDDDEARSLFELSAMALKPGGRLVTYDPCFTDTQSALARFLVRQDRGQNVRKPEQYAELASRSFGGVRPFVLDGHLRIPYTAVILECDAPVTTEPLPAVVDSRRTHRE